MKNAYHKNQTELNNIIKPRCVAAITEHSRKQFTVKESKTEESGPRRRNKKMTQENKEREGTQITWDELNLGGNYIKFEKDVRKKLVIKNWELLQKEGKKYESEEMELKTFFVADVLVEDKITCEKILSSSSRPLLVGMKKILMDQAPEVARLISVKKLGEGTKTTYDIEDDGVFEEISEE